MHVHVLKLKEWNGRLLVWRNNYKSPRKYRNLTNPCHLYLKIWLMRALNRSTTQLTIQNHNLSILKLSTKWEVHLIQLTISVARVLLNKIKTISKKIVLKTTSKWLFRYKHHWTNHKMKDFPLIEANTMFLNIQRLLIQIYTRSSLRCWCFSRTK